MSTDFTNNNTTISASGGLQPTTRNTPLDVRTRVNSKADIESIPNPFVGMKIIVLQDETNNNEMTEYIVVSLKADNLGIAGSKVNQVVLVKDFLGVNESASGSGMTEEQVQHLNDAYAHSQTPHVQQSDIPTKTSELTNDSGFMTEVPSEYITEQELNAKGYLTEHQDISNKADRSEVPTRTSQLTNDSNFLTQHQDISGKANKSEIPTKTSQLQNDSDFATNASVDEKIANVSTGGTVDLTEYAKKTDLPTKTSQLTNDSGFITSIPSEYVTESELNTELSTKANKSEIPSLDGYATETFVTNKIAEASLSGGSVDLSGLGADLSLNGQTLKLKNSSGQEIGTGVTLPETTTIDAYTKTETDEIIQDYTGGKKQVYLTQAEYDQLTEVDKNDSTKVYNITDATEQVIPVDLTINDSNLLQLKDANGNSIGTGVTVSTTSGGTSYTLPTASSTVLGGIKVGSNLSIDSNGVLSATVIDSGMTDEEVNTVLMNVFGENYLPQVYGNIIVSVNELSINEGESKTFTVSLSQVPTSAQTITISSNNSDVTVNPSSIDISDTNPHTITVAASEDEDYDNDTAILTLNSSNVSNVTVNVTVIDNDIEPIACESITLNKTELNMGIFSSEGTEGGETGGVVDDSNTNYIADAQWQTGELDGVGGIATSGNSANCKYCKLTNLPIGEYTLHHDSYNYKKVCIKAYDENDSKNVLKTTDMSNSGATTDVKFKISCLNTVVYISLVPNGSNDFSGVTLKRQDLPTSTIQNKTLSPSIAGRPGWAGAASTSNLIELQIGNTTEITDITEIRTVSIGNDTYNVAWSQNGVSTVDVVEKYPSKCIANTVYENNWCIIMNLPASKYGTTVDSFKSYCTNNGINEIVINSSNATSGGGTGSTELLTYTLKATVTPTNTTDTVVWSVEPAGICTVDNGNVTAVANGDCVVTATCGQQSATCNVTVSGLNEVTESTIYQLPQETVFNGSNTYIETEIALFGDEYLNTDWTMLLDFTDNGSSTQASIAHCVDELSPYPGLSVKFYNGNCITSIYGKAVTLCSQDTNRHKFVITKSGNTFTFYNESMTQLDAKTFDNLATVTQTLILGCSENTTGYKGPYVKGTLHRLKIVQGVMSREDCLAWMA